MHFRFRPRFIPSALVVILSLLALPLGAADSVHWRNIGPGGGGNIWSISIKPDDPNVILMGSDVGGFYRSGDGGNTWALVNSQAKIDPTRYGDYTSLGAFGWDPATDPNPGSPTFGKMYIAYKGVYRSTDAGVTWTASAAMDTPGSTSNIRYLLTGGVVDPHSNNHDYVYAWSTSLPYVYRTTDHWTATANVSCKRLDNGTCDPANDSVTDPIHSVVMNPNPAASGQLMACAESGIYYNPNWTSWSAVSFTGLPTDQAAHPHCAQMRAKGGTLFIVLRTYIDGVLHEGLQPTNPYVNVANWQGGVYVCSLVDWDHGTASCSAANGSDSNDLLMGRGSFEGLPDGTHPAQYWKLQSGAVVQDSDFFHSGSGTHSLKFTKTSDRTSIIQDFNPPLTVSGGELMKVSLWVYADEGSGFVPLVFLHTFSDTAATTSVIPPFQLDDGLVALNQYGIQSGDWKKYEGFVRVPDEAHSVKLEVDVSGADPGTTSDVWFDDVELRINHSLPRMTSNVYSAAYSDIAVDSENSLFMYALTRESSIDTSLAGVWKTSDGGVNWNHVTREGWHENVVDEALSVPKCGDGVCGGRWETCETCPIDCGAKDVPQMGDCCGAGGLPGRQPGPDENSYTCLVDVPWDPDPNISLPYREADYFLDRLNVQGPTMFTAYLSPNGGDPLAASHALAIGNGTLGHNTLFFGNSRWKTSDGGLTWTATHGTQFSGMGLDAGSMQARGDSTDTFVSSILTVPGCGSTGCVYYGDHDNRLMMSYNGGASFEQEGWEWDKKAYSAACPNPNLTIGAGGDLGITPTSIILGPSNSVYAGISVGFDDESALPAFSNLGGAVKGVGPQNPTAGLCQGRWTWTDLGHNFPKGGSSDLIYRSSSGRVFAAVYGKGVYMLTSESGDWSTQHLPMLDEPTGLKVTKIAGSSDSRIFVGAGNRASSQPPPGETGVWEICSEYDTNPTLYRIAGGQTGSPMASEPVTSLLPIGTDVLFVSTFWASLDVQNPLAHGGVYKGTRNTSAACGAQNEWTWNRVLAQPEVSGVVVSSGTSSALYAMANQVCCSTPIDGQNAGIWKSDDGGANWSLLPNDGLMDLQNRKPSVSQLRMSNIDPFHIYYGSIGAGLFEGTITCGIPAEGFADTDNDGVADCSDTDDDNDGILDVSDNCPLVFNPGQENADGDALGDACDADDDNDGVLDASDNCPLVFNPGQENCDGDAQGNACDADDDNDGSPDTADCDDCNPAVRPGIPEDCSDPADNDCNGVPDTSEPSCQANVAATNVTNGSTAVMNKSCNLPSGINSGDLLLLALRSSGNETHSTPSGWSQMIVNDTSDGSDDRTSLWYKKANGTEGSTVVINGTVSLKFSCLSWRITGAADPAIQPPQVSTVATGNSAAPNPAALSPTGGTKLYLWIWLGGWEGKQTSPPAGNPTNYSSNKFGANSGTSGATETNCRLASATRNVNASSEDPGSWTISAADDWTAYTIAVHP